MRLLQALCLGLAATLVLAGCTVNQDDDDRGDTSIDNDDGGDAGSDSGDGTTT